MSFYDSYDGHKVFQKYGNMGINMDQNEYTYSAVARTLTHCCTHNTLVHALYIGTRKPVESESIS